MMKKRALFIIICLMVVLSVSAVLTVSAANDGRQLLYTDGCTDASLANTNIVSNSKIVYDTGKGFKREADGVGHVIFKSEQSFGKIDFRLWNVGGKNDFDWAMNTGNILLKLYISTSLDGTYTAIPFTYEEGEKLTDGFYFNCEATTGGLDGYKFLKVEFTSEAGWFPQLNSISFYGLLDSEVGNFPPEEAEKPIFIDECTDLLEVASFDDNIKQDPRGFTRTNKEPGAVTYATEENVGRVELILDIAGGFPAWDYDSNRFNYNMRIFVAQAAGGAYSELSYTASQYSAVTEGWGKVKLVSQDIASNVKNVKLLMDANGAMDSWGVCIRKVSIYKASGEAPEVTEITITNSVLQFGSGFSLDFTAETKPAGAPVFFEVYDNAALSQPSNYAQFDGNTLKASFYDAEDKVVYVVAKSGSAVSASVIVTIKSRPDATSVTFTASKNSIVVTETLTLTASVLPAHAINTEAEFVAFIDEECTQTAIDVTILDGKLSLKVDTQMTEFYVKARVLKMDDSFLYSDAQKFTVEYKKVLFKDDCKSFDNIDASLNDLAPFEIHKGTIHRYFQTTLPDPNYAVLGNGSARTDYSKNGVSSLTYKTYGDISEFMISIITYDEGNGALNAANKNNYLGLINIYTSADNNNWTYLPLDFTANNDVGNEFVKTAYSKINYFNSQPIAAGMRYIRIDFIGQIALTETSNGALWSYEPFTGVLPAERYDEISLFYNSYSPLLSSLQLYAENDAEIDREILSLYGKENMSVRVGEESKITLFQVLSDDPSKAVEITDFSNVSYTFLTSGSYLSLLDGSDKVTVAAGYNQSGIVTVTLKATIGDFTSDVITVRIIVPVTSVTVSAERNNLVVNESVKLTATVEPTGASLKAVTWLIVSGEGELLADGTFTATAEGNVIIKAIADGISSEEIKLTVTKAVAPPPPIEEGGCYGCGSITFTDSLFLLPAILMLFAGALMIAFKRKKAK